MDNTYRAPPRLGIGLITALAAASVALYVNKGRKYIALKGRNALVYLDIKAPGSPVIYCDAKSELMPSALEMCRIVAQFAKLESILISTVWAFLIPLLPIAITTLTNMGRLQTDAGFRRRLSLRFLLYLAVFFVRTVVLYLGINALETALQGPESQSCWYQEHRGERGCKDRFNIGDHLILMMVHYIAIPTFELEALRVESPDSPVFHLVNFVVKGIVICACISIYISSAYFHTRPETIAGLVVSLVAVFLPMKLIYPELMGTAITPAGEGYASVEPMEASTTADQAATVRKAQ